jgi:Rps23 Pro-64 3,4-dihydroxylase Tpa1-like proline 4-hydroxylase
VSRFGREIVALHSAGHTALNSTAFVSSHSDGERPAISCLIPKPGVFETELTPEVRKEVGAIMPELVGLHAALPGIEAHLASLLPSMQLSVAQQRSSIKLQFNTGGSGPGRAFPFHFDSPGGSKDSRRLTMLLYLNEKWQKGDGGELVLQPFLTPAVRIAPRAGRMVLFKSDALLHRVLPSTAERKCLTIWLHCKPQQPTASPSAAAAPASAESPQTQAEAANAEQPQKQSSPEAATAAGASSPTASIAPSPSSSPSPSEAQASSSPTTPTVQDDDADSDAFAALWMSRIQDPAWQRVLARAIYLDEWRQSFLQAHGRATDTEADNKQAEGAAIATAASPAAVCYVSGGAAHSSSSSSDAQQQQQQTTMRGAEPLVESLESDAARLETELAGTGILELLRRTAQEQQDKTIDV